MKLPRTPLYQLVLSKFELPEKAITKLQGNPDASILVLAPVPTITEINHGMPWVNPCAQKFVSVLNQETGLDHNAHLRIVPACIAGTKMSKADSEPIANYLYQCSKSNNVRLIICIGAEPFKAFFGHGKKPSMPSIVGQTMYVKETKFKPLFVFDDVHTLVPVRVGDRRADFIAEMNSQDAEKRLRRVCSVFHQQFAAEPWWCGRTL